MASLSELLQEVQKTCAKNATLVAELRSQKGELESNLTQTAAAREHLTSVFEEQAIWWRAASSRQQWFGRWEHSRLLHIRSSAR